jgi:hypothetical protein
VGVVLARINGSQFTLAENVVVNTPCDARKLGNAMNGFKILISSITDDLRV